MELLHFLVAGRQRADSLLKAFWNLLACATCCFRTSLQLPLWFLSPRKGGAPRQWQEESRARKGRGVEAKVSPLSALGFSSQEEVAILVGPVWTSLQFSFTLLTTTCSV